MTTDTIKEVLSKIMSINRNLNGESLKSLLVASGWDKQDIEEGVRIFEYYSGNFAQMGNGDKDQEIGMDLDGKNEETFALSKVKDVVMGNTVSDSDGQNISQDIFENIHFHKPDPVSKSVSQDLPISTEWNKKVEQDIDYNNLGSKIIKPDDLKSATSSISEVKKESNFSLDSLSLTGIDEKRQKAAEKFGLSQNAQEPFFTGNKEDFDILSKEDNAKIAKAKAEEEINNIKIEDSDDKTLILDKKEDLGKEVIKSQMNILETEENTVETNNSSIFIVTLNSVLLIFITLFIIYMILV